MQKYQDVASIIGPPGLIPVVGVNVYVYNHGTSTQAAIFSDNVSTATVNPIITDNSGRYSFYAADGRYDLTVSGAGIQSTTITDIELQDNPSTAALAASSGAANIGFSQNGTGAVSTTVQAQLRKTTFLSDWDTSPHYDTAKAALSVSSAVAFLEVIAAGLVKLNLTTHKDTNYTLGEGTAGSAMQVYSQIITDPARDLVLAVGGIADIHLGNIAGGTGNLFIDMDVRVSAWSNGNRGHGMRILQQDGSASMEFPSSSGIIEVGSSLRGGNGATSSFTIRNSNPLGTLTFLKSDNSAATLILADSGLLKLGSTQSFAVSPDGDVARVKGGGSASAIIFYPNQAGAGTGGVFRFNNNATDDQIVFEILATAGVAVANRIQIRGASTGANASIGVNAGNLSITASTSIVSMTVAGPIGFYGTNATTRPGSVGTSFASLSMSSGALASTLAIALNQLGLINCTSVAA